MKKPTKRDLTSEEKDSLLSALGGLFLLEHRHGGGYRFTPEFCEGMAYQTTVKYDIATHSFEVTYG